MPMPVNMMSAPNVQASGVSPENLAQMRKKAVELEGVFLNTLVSEMMSSIDTDGAFGGGYAEETWRSMQSEQIADEMARAGGIGLADRLVEDMIAQQNAAYTAQLMNSSGNQ